MSAARVSRVLSNAGLPAFRCGFAYGSGVFAQRGRERATEQPMLDVVLVVDDAARWHRANLASNASHYSWVGSCGASAVARVQGCSAGVYYNTRVPLAGAEWSAMKYGVVSTEQLVRDLEDWDWLYLAGRLHKPVAWLPGSKSDQAAAMRLSDEDRDALGPSGDADDAAPIRAALDANLRHALNCALLLLPERFAARELWVRVARLSYDGDVRFAFGAEDAGKVENIVAGDSAPRFAHLFEQPLQMELASGALLFRDRDPDGADDFFEQPKTAVSVAARVDALPRALREKVRASRSAPHEALETALRETVFRSSAEQTLKGLATAGAGKAAAYVKAKLSKGWASRRR